MGYEGKLAKTVQHRIQQGITKANDSLLLWTGLTLLGLVTLNPLVTLITLPILYTGFATLHALNYNPSPLYVIITFALALTLQENITALFVIAMLYTAEIIFNVLYKISIKPFYHVFPLGFELVLFNTVFIGYNYGSIAGAITGLLFGTTYYGIIFNFNSSYQYINIPAYATVGILAGTLTLPFITTGITLAIAYAITTSTIITLLHGGKLHKTITFITSNIAFNYWLFTTATPLL